MDRKRITVKHRCNAHILIPPSPRNPASTHFAVFQAHLMELVPEKTTELPSFPVQRVSHFPSPLTFPVMKTGTIQQANGSAYIETGSLKLLCAVYGEFL